MLNLRGRPPGRAAGNIGAIQRPGCIGQICIIELVDIGANGHRTDDNMSTRTTF